MYLLDINQALAGEDSINRYDLFRFTACLQGLLNREKPTLFLLWEEHDRFWLEYITAPGKFLENEPCIPLSSFEELLTVFADCIRRCGLILWDPTVPATLNAATTACGTDGYLPIREGSAAERIRTITGASVRLDLRGRFTGTGLVWETDEPSTGSAKCDAYVWALHRFMERCAEDLLEFSPDGMPWRDEEPFYPDMGNAFVPNMDYAVSRRAFVFDLFCFGDEAPCDDPAQPVGCDLAMMKRILLEQYRKTEGRKITTVCGFNPWHIKYTSHGGHGSHDPVEVEWRLSEVLSAFNCVKDADAAGYCGLANASVYRHFPLQPQYRNRPPKPPVGGYDPRKTYILFYVGDYDSAAWTARFVPRWFRDPALGQLPLMWCFNPNLSDRIPMAFDFVYNHYTGNDWFEAGDSGAGYNNPRLLYEPRIHSDLPSGAESNIAHSLPYFRQFDMSVIGFVINSHYPLDGRQMYDLSRFAGDGVAHNCYGEPACIVNGTPFMPHTCDIAVENRDPAAAARQAVDWMNAAAAGKRFHIFRTILVSPSNHVKIYEEILRLAPEKNIELLDPLTFFRYLKLAVEKGETY